ncbi:MAG: amidohydrolase family protein [Armatimonadetes bacterium]|nr:amidohydrolase family protein [Armatimonadota bacterium]
MPDGGMSRRGFVEAMGAAGLAEALGAAADPAARRASASGGGTIAWAADRVFDGESVLTAHAVLLTGAEVTGVRSTHKVPPHVPVQYEPGTTILPGLVDAHVHHMQWEAPLFLAYGVTTIRDVGNDLSWILARRAEASAALCPTILCTGPLLDGPTPIHPLVARASADLEAAVAAVRETAQAGVDAIKLYCGLLVEWLPAMAREARSHGLRTSMHCQGTGVLAAANAGVGEFHHLDGVLTDVWPDRPAGWLEVWGDSELATTRDAQRRFADRIAEAAMAATPTLAYWHSQWRIRAADHSPEAEAPGVPPEMLAWQGLAAIDPDLADRWRRAREAAEGFLRLLHERGVPILAGSDVPCGAQTPGLSLWREMCMLARVSMSPVQALRAGTSALGTLLGRPKLGRLQGGSPADLVIVRGDPTRGIPESPEVVAVVRGGAAHRPTDLLAEAQRLSASVTEDPWSAQFRAHAGGGPAEP